MAKAPDPGKLERQKAREEAEPKILRLTVGDKTVVLDFDQLGPADDLLARQQAGFPVSTFVGMAAFSGDSLLVLWWLARRKNGERRLAFGNVLKDFPTNKAIEEAGFKAEWVTADELDADPES